MGAVGVLVGDRSFSAIQWVNKGVVSIDIGMDG